MRIRTTLFSALAGLAMAVGATASHAQAREEGRLLLASQVLEELRVSRDQMIPDRLLERAYGIAVIPDMTKIAFFAGGRRGDGILVYRDKDGRFTNPIFITMTGGSFGWQWGVQKTDIVLVFTTKKGIEGITGGKVTLGADASVAAGPVGRESSASTDMSFKAEVYSYSRSRGVFAGLAIDGTVISIDDDENEAFYKKHGVTATDIAAGTVTTNDDAARRFMTAVTTSTRGQQSASAAPVPASASAAPSPSQSGVGQPTAPAQPSPSPLTSSGGAQSFPAEDTQPGREPQSTQR
ncbi:MAG TPA: lipid-binding SYLF domain-containing protein [Steroidobacteraceae bacterium]